MRGARGSSVAAAAPPRPLRRVFSRRTESGAREAKSVRGNTAAADGPGARLAAPVASRSPAVVLRCLQLPPGVSPACSGLPRRCAAPSPPPPAPRPQKSALQPLSPRPWEVRVRSGGDRFARGSTESRRSHSEASGLSAGKVPDGGHKPPPARGSIFFSCPLNLGRDRGCLDHTGEGTPRQSPIPPCRSPPFPRSSSSIHPSASAAEHTGDGDSQACAAERFAQTSA